MTTGELLLANIFDYEANRKPRLEVGVPVCWLFYLAYRMFVKRLLLREKGLDIGVAPADDMHFAKVYLGPCLDKRAGYASTLGIMRRFYGLQSEARISNYNTHCKSDRLAL